MLLSLLTSSLSFQPNQDAMDNFDSVDLSWVRHTMDPLEVLSHGWLSCKIPPRLMRVTVRFGVIYMPLLPQGHHSGGV